MTDRANIKLPREKYERHRERKEKLGVSWAEYIDGQAPEQPDVEVGPVTLEATERRKIAEEVVENLR